MNDAFMDGSGGSSFKASLRKRAVDIRRMATKRTIEMYGYSCETWYSPPLDTTGMDPLSLDQFLTGREPVEADSLYKDSRHYYAGYGGEVWNHVYAEFDWVEERFTGYGNADPLAMRSLVESVRDVPAFLMGDTAWYEGTELTNLKHFEGGDPLGTVFGDGAMPVDILLQTAMQELSYWDGATAEAYTRTFGANGERWESLAQNNYALAVCLTSALEAQLALVLAFRESLVGVQNATMLSLWDVNDSPSQPVKAATVIAIIGAVVGVSLSMASLGLTAPVVGAAFAITGALVAAADSAKPAPTGVPGSPAEISGATPRQVVESMADKLDGLDGSCDEEVERIRAAVRAACDAVSASADARSKFEITLGGDAPRDDWGTREVSLSTGDLENVATVLFPKSASRVLTGNRRLLGVGGDGGAEFTADWRDETTPVHPPWIELRDLLRSLTEHNGDRIRFAGEFLLDYAVEVGAVDAANAETLHRTYDGLDAE